MYYLRVEVVQCSSSEVSLLMAKGPEPRAMSHEPFDMQLLDSCKMFPQLFQVWRK